MGTCERGGILLVGWFLNVSRYSHGEGNGTPLQCSCLENPRDGGAWWAAVVYGVTQSRTRLKRLSSSSRYSHPQSCHHVSLPFYGFGYTPSCLSLPNFICNCVFCFSNIALMSLKSSFILTQSLEIYEMGLQTKACRLV